MKINKVLRVLHFFGLCNDKQHLDDVSVRILDNNVFKNQDDVASFVNSATKLGDFFDIGDIFYSNFEKITDKGIAHIKKIAYTALQEDKIFKRRCDKVRTVYVIFPDHSVKPIRYIDDILYWIGTDDDAYNRAIKIEKLLN